MSEKDYAEPFPISLRSFHYGGLAIFAMIPTDISYEVLRFIYFLNSSCNMGQDT